MGAIAFFDLDKTLLSINSSKYWAFALRAQGRLTSRHILGALFWLTKYRFGWGQLDQKHIETLGKAFKGISADEMETYIQEHYLEELKSTVRPGAASAIEKHRRKGELCVMLTSSPQIIPNFVGKYLRMDAVLSTQLEWDQDRIFTGNLLSEVCFAEGKVTAAKAFCAKKSIPLEACFFYTDSATDLPLLEAVGHPICVEPDPRLKRLAMIRGWRIEDWGKRRK